MARRIRSTVSFANVVAMLALFVALGGASYAAVVLPANSVGPRQIRTGAVRSSDVHDGTIVAEDLGPSVNQALTAPRTPIGPAGGSLAGSYPNPSIAPSAVGPGELKPDAVPADGTGLDGSTKLASGSVNAQELRAGSVRAQALGRIQIVTNATAIARGGDNASVSAICPAGSTVISGGAQPGLFGIELTSTRPNGNGWLAQAKNNTGTDSTLTAFALCLLG